MFLEKASRGYNRWYLYIFTLIAVFAVVQVASFPLIIYSIWYAKDSFQENLTIPLLVTNTNMGLALVLLTFVAGVFALIFCVKHIHRKQTADILTGRDRFDVKRCLFGAAVWSILILILLGLQYALGDTSNLVFQFQPLNFFVMCLVIFSLIPFQVAFEEFLFRGYLMQGFALLFKYRWIAFLLTGVSFGLLHATNPEVERFGFWVAIPQYVLMGLILSYVTVKDDGLELALGLHLSNNILSSVLVTHEASALQTHALFRELYPTASHWDSILMLICGIIFISICHRKYHLLSKINLWRHI